MIKKILLPFFIILTSASFIKAQSNNPGYLGKKNLLSYNLTANMSDFSFNFINKINYERVVSKKSSLLFFVGLQRNKVEQKKAGSSGIGFNEWTFNTVSFGFNYRKYKSLNVMAPLGFYKEFGLAYQTSYANTDGIEFIISGSNATLVDFDNLVSYRLNYGLGYNRIIADKYLITYGFEIALIITDDPSDFITSEMENKLLREDFGGLDVSYGIKIGFGFLP